MIGIDAYGRIHIDDEWLGRTPPKAEASQPHPDGIQHALIRPRVALRCALVRDIHEREKDTLFAHVEDYSANRQGIPSEQGPDGRTGKAADASDIPQE